MRNFVRALVFSAVTVASGAALADAGGIPNEHACNPGNAVFCRDGGSGGSSTAQVPEMDVAGLPVVLGLLSALCVISRRRVSDGKAAQ